jgi:hypothetical protein
MTFNYQSKTVRLEKPLAALSRFKRLASLLAGMVCLALLLNSAQASSPAPATYSLTLQWNPSESPQITSYHVYYGTASGNYTNSLVAGNVTTATVPALSFGVTYYFAITATDADGVESAFSNEISYQQNPGGAQMVSRGLVNGQFTLTVTGTTGHTYDLEATQDFTNWTVIGTGTVDGSGSLNFTDPNAANFQQRFYRTHDTQP